jgi:predicted Fe-Mo cluster-binding NifX family protein
MKICFTSGASGLDAPVNSGLGRHQFFKVVGTDGMIAKLIPNFRSGSSGRAGIQAALADAGLGATALITENIGQILLSNPNDSAKNTASQSTYGV